MSSKDKVSLRTALDDFLLQTGEVSADDPALVKACLQRLDVDVPESVIASHLATVVGETGGVLTVDFMLEMAEALRAVVPAVVESEVVCETAESDQVDTIVESKDECELILSNRDAATAVAIEVREVDATRRSALVHQWDVLEASDHLLVQDRLLSAIHALPPLSGVALDAVDADFALRVKKSELLPAILKEVVLQKQWLFVSVPGRSADRFIDMSSWTEQSRAEARTGWHKLTSERQIAIKDSLEDKFRIHVAKFEMKLEKEDEQVLFYEWVEKFLFEQMALLSSSSVAFPFTGNAWPNRTLSRFQEMWQQLSAEQQTQLNLQLQEAFNTYMKAKSLDVDNEEEELFWESWGLHAFSEERALMFANSSRQLFQFTPTVSIDVLQNEESKQVALMYLNQVTEDHVVEIDTRVAKEMETLRQQLVALPAVKLAKYEKQLLERKYWDIVADVVTASFPTLGDTHVPIVSNGTEKSTTGLNSGGTDLASAAVRASVSGSPVTSPTKNSKVRKPSPVASSISKRQRVDLDGSPSIARMLNEQSSPCGSSSRSELQFANARGIMCGQFNGARWIYECVLVRSDFDRTNNDGEPKKGVTVLTCDDTGPLLVTVWEPLTEEFCAKVDMLAGTNERLRLRFEQLRFTPLPNNTFNGTSATTIKLGHTFTRDAKRKGSGKALSADSSGPVPAESLSLRDGTRLTFPTDFSSPHMKSTGAVAFAPPIPPHVVSSFNVGFKSLSAPFRMSLMGTVQDVEEVEPTNTGDVRRRFKLSDGSGKWVYIYAHGAHADNEAIENFRKVVLYFTSARGTLGSVEPGLWLFKDAFIASLEKQVVAPLTDRIEWTEAIVQG